ncbi:MAG TPA: hypothetical protein VI365_31795 [Trebonia sp.]
MLRASLGTTLAVLGALGATAAGTLTANASTTVEPPDTFTVVSAAASTTNPDQLTVVVDSPSTLNGLTAQFETISIADAYSQALTQQSSEADPSDPNQTQTTWTADIPAGTSGLPLGSYYIGLKGTYSDGNSSSVTNAGTFSFDATSSVTLAAANTSFSYPLTPTVLSGTVTLTNPDGTPDTDYTGVSVQFLSNGDTVGSATIASDGKFSDPSFTPSASETIVAKVVAGWVESSESTPPVNLIVTDTTPTLKLTVNPVTETYGKAVTVTGTLSYTSGSTSAPVANQGIWISTEPGGADALVKGTTSGNGSFGIVLPEQATGRTLYVGSTSAPGLSAAVAVPLTLKVVHPTDITSFKVSLSQYWGLSVSGCLGLPSTDKTGRITHTSGLTVQYDQTGTWKNLFKISGNEADHTCGTGGIEFSGSSTAQANYADYRIVYAGTTGATSYAATHSITVLAWKYDDRIADFTVSPTTVNAGGKLTIKGTLQYYYSGWHSYSGRVISIDLRPEGSSTWYWLVRVTTNSKGQFSATFKDPISATWQAVYGGNTSGGGHLSADSSEVYVRLK